ncbi:MAG: hypothetical protein DMG60_22815 [Acidobacteria bacterium]|nr:MAG: hypothetical protein DMG60_22815 [Acidobacteriota bacterium]
MSDHSPQELLQKMTQLFNRFRRTGDMAPIEDRREWEELVASKPPEERDLLTELARFADLWRYLRDRDEKLGSEIVEAISQVHHSPVPERIARLKAINKKLMERVGDAGEDPQFRQ